MLSLDKVVAGAKVRGLAGAVPVEVVRTEWIGSDALNVVRALAAFNAALVRCEISSRCPCLLAFAALINRSTSASIKYSRVRSVALETRRGGTIPLKCATTAAADRL
jgi:hypothetical protein